MAEFETAIFRVYERCIENLRDEDDGTLNSRTCKLMENIALAGGLLFLLILIILHSAFVNQPGCLPGLLQQEMVRGNYSSMLPFDAILQINVDKYFVGDMPSHAARLVDTDDAVASEGRRRRRLRSRLSLGVSPQASDGTPTSFADSRLSFRFPRDVNAAKSSQPSRRKTRPQFGLYGMFFNFYHAERAPSQHEFQPHQHPDQERLTGHASHAMAADAPLWTSVLRRLGLAAPPHNYHHTNSTAGNATAEANATDSIFDPLYYRVHDFEFAYDIGILELSGYLRQIHRFQLINVTMEGPLCMGNRLLQGLIPLGGIETVVLNSIFATLQRGGMMIDSHGDFNLWRERDVHPYSNPSEWLGFKVDVLAKSLFLFFLLTTVTALLVRMLISSGVVLLFPIFWFIQYLGYNVINMRLISLSYPWIGVPLEMLRSQNQSSVPFLIGHMTRVVAYYTFYEATQFACSLWFYDQSQPGQRELWLFAIMMLWEYFSMIYVRAAGSIILFPRASLALFLVYHFYLFSFPTGFHLLALLVMLFFLLYLMMLCVRKYEIEAYHRGFVTSDQPRQFYNSIPWPVWSNGLAPEYSVFIPAARRSTSMYNMNVPPPPGAGPGPMVAGVGASAGAAGAEAEAGGAGAGASEGAAGVELSSTPFQATSTASSRPQGQREGRAAPQTYQRLPDNSSH